MDRALQRLSGSADVILIPEIPFDIEQGVREDPAAARRPAGISASSWWRKARGPRRQRSSCWSAGASARWTVSAESASKVAQAIGQLTGKETRTLVLGHLQRGGSPTTYDRLLALRFGAAAVRAIADRAFGTMVGLNGSEITRVPLEDVVGKSKNVPLDCDTIRTARELGISLGD